MRSEGDYITTLYHSLRAVFAKTLVFLKQTAEQLQKKLKAIKRRLPLAGKRYAHSFPAVHLHRDFWTSLPNFTSELLVGMLVLGVAGFNIWSLYIIRPSDSSLAAKLLSYHSNANPKYYAYNSSVRTVVVGTDGFAPEAFAQSAAGNIDASTTEVGSTPGSDTTGLITNDAIVRPDPDSIKDLVAKQFQVYEVKPGDTLLSIALKFQLNRSTLQWTNKLPDNTVKPGYELLIPPTDGVAVTASSNDTIPDLAKKFHGNIETIISYNGLENEEDIAPGQIVIIPGGYIAAPPAPKKPKAGSNPGTALEDVGSTHIFPRGYCTYYVAHKMIIKGFGGDAKYWLGNAKATGYETGSRPIVGSAVVTTENRRYGHVAYVEQVTDNYIVVSEMNFEHWNKIDTRRIPLGSSVIRGYIYPKY